MFPKEELPVKVEAEVPPPVRGLERCRVRIGTVTKGDVPGFVLLDIGMSEGLKGS